MQSGKMSKNVYFTVGPTQLFETVSTHLETALATDVLSASHRGGWFVDLYQETLKNLRDLMRIPDSYEIFFTASGHEGMERGIQNCVVSKSAHVVYGSFSKRWAWVAQSLGKKTEEYAVSPGLVPNLADAHFSDDIEFLALTQNETSTGGAMTPESISSIRERFPNTLIGIDSVSSTPVVELDWNAVDYMFFGTQKAFGLPAGLGVIIVSQKALAASVEVSKHVSIGSYHSFSELQRWGKMHQTPETPNVLGIYLFNAVLRDMLSIGLPSLKAGVERRAKKFYEFLTSQDTFTPFVTDTAGQSLTTIAVQVKGGSVPVVEKLKAKGLIVGAGYGDRKEKDIRVANFPAHTDEQFERLISELRSLA